MGDRLVAFTDEHLRALEGTLRCRYRLRFLDGLKLHLSFPLAHMNSMENLLKIRSRLLNIRSRILHSLSD